MSLATLLGLFPLRDSHRICTVKEDVGIRPPCLVRFVLHCFRRSGKLGRLLVLAAKFGPPVFYAKSFNSVRETLRSYSRFLLRVVTVKRCISVN